MPRSLKELLTSRRQSTIESNPFQELVNDKLAKERAEIIKEREEQKREQIKEEARLEEERRVHDQVMKVVREHGLMAIFKIMKYFCEAVKDDRPFEHVQVVVHVDGENRTMVGMNEEQLELLEKGRITELLKTYSGRFSYFPKIDISKGLRISKIYMSVTRLTVDEGGPEDGSTSYGITIAITPNGLNVNGRPAINLEEVVTLIKELEKKRQYDY